MVLNAMYCLGSITAPQSAVPVAIGSRQSMAQVYYEKALSYLSPILQSSSELSVLSLFMLFLCSMKMDKIQESLYYFSMAVQMAKEIGINKESSIGTLSDFNYERESMRRLWWCLFLMDHFLSEKNMNLIEFSDNQIFLPDEKSDNGNVLDKTKYVGMQTMNSMQVFLPGLRNQGLAAYRLLLTKISSQALKFNYLSKFEPSNPLVANPLYIMGALSGSLREWFWSLPDFITIHCQLARDGVIHNPAFTWRVIYTYVQYNHIKSLVFNPSLLKNILESSSLVTLSNSYIETVSVAHENSKLLTMFLQRNPKFDHTTTAIASYIFNIAFNLILCSRLEASETIEHIQILDSLDIHMRSLREHTTSFENVPVLIETLEYFLTLTDPREIISQFTKFKAMRGSAPTVIKFLPKTPIEKSPQFENSTPPGMENYGNWGQTSGNSNNDVDQEYINLLLSSDPFFTK
jgi:hypothetical protein